MEVKNRGFPAKTIGDLLQEIEDLKSQKAALLAACQRVLPILKAEVKFSLTEKEKELFPITTKEVKEISDTIEQIQSAIEQAGEVK